MWIILLLLVALSWTPVAFAQTTITIPADPAIATLQAQVTTLEQRAQALTQQVRVLSTPPVPLLDQFKAIMIDSTSNTATTQGTYGGGYWCGQYNQYAGNPGGLFASDLIYYDAARVMYQIADYTHDPKWNACAKTAVKAYRDGYLNVQPDKNGVQNHAGVPGYQVFPKGLYMDWLRTGDPLSQQAVLDLAYHASFAIPVPTSWVPGPGSIREISYTLEAKFFANDLGEKIDYTFHLNRLKLYWAQMLWMLQNQTSDGMPATLTPDPLVAGDKYVRPFMVGIGAEALIEYYQRTNDASVLGLIRPVLGLMWTQAYDGKGAMLYTVPQANGACPWTADNSDQCDNRLNGSQAVLNMLIAPAYMWVYQQTGDVVWRDRADALFAGVVSASSQTGFLCCPAGKGFNQVFKWFPEYFGWR